MRPKKKAGPELDAPGPRSVTELVALEAEDHSDAASDVAAIVQAATDAARYGNTVADANADVGCDSLGTFIAAARDSQVEARVGEEAQAAKCDRRSGRARQTLVKAVDLTLQRGVASDTCVRFSRNLVEQLGVACDTCFGLSKDRVAVCRDTIIEQLT